MPLPFSRMWFSRLLLGGLACAISASCNNPDSTSEAPAEPGAGRATGSAAELAAPEMPAVDLSSIPPDSVIELAIAAFDRGEYDSARTVLSRALERGVVGADTAVQARALTWLSYTTRYLGQYAEARRFGEESLELKLGAGIREELWRSYNALGLLAWWESRLPEAAELFDRALAAAEAMADREAIAKVENNRGLIHFELGNFDQARQGFETLLDVGRTLGSVRDEAEALTNLGMLETALGDPRTAIPRLERARDLFASIGELTREQVALGHLGTAYLAVGDAGAAHSAFDSALAVARGAGLRPDEAQNLELLGHVYGSAGEPRRALRHFQAAKEINLELGDDLYAGIDLRSEAVLLATLGDLPSARQRALQALELHAALGVPLHELKDRIVLAEIAQASGDASEAERQLAASEPLVEALSARVARIDLALARARIAAADDRSDDVLSALRSFEAEHAFADYDQEWEAAALRSQAFLRLGALDSAAAAGRAAVSTVERVRKSFGSGVLRTSFASARARTYSDLVEILLRLGEREEAFEVADAARGRALAEHLASGPAADADPTTRAVAEGERLLRAIEALSAAIAGEQAGELPPVIASGELADRLRTARTRYEDHLLRLAEQSRPAAAALGVGSVSLGEIQAALRPGQLLLEYLVTPERLVIFIVTPADLFIAESDVSSANLFSRVRVARDLLARADVTDEDAAGIVSELYDRLIEPAARAAPIHEASGLIIVPHAALAYLPFGALRDKVTGRYLAESYAISHLPAAGTLPLLRQSGRAVAGQAAHAGVEVFVPHPRRLPATAAEARSIARAVDGARISREARATEASVRRALRTARGVHLASHAALIPENPMFSFVELATADGDISQDDGRLEVHEVLGLGIRSPLVFLSGCETGLGRAWSSRFNQGEDFATLARAFLYAGAGSVIATLWRIEDDGAAEFARLFYSELAAGAAPALALARAQRSLMKTRRYGSPYYWATYRFSGG